VLICVNTITDVFFLIFQVLDAYRGVIVTSLANAIVTSLPYENIVLNESLSHDSTVY